MIASGQRQFRNWLGGRRPQVGYRGSAPVAQLGRNHQNEQQPEMAAMASTKATVPAPATSFTRSSKWNKWWGNACIAGC